jgi:FixJ family two-component response regulator
VRFNNINMEGVYRRGLPPRIHLSARRPLPRRAYNCAHELGHHVFGHGSSIDELREDAKAQPWEDPKEFLALVAWEESARDQRDAVSKMGRSGDLAPVSRNLPATDQEHKRQHELPFFSREVYAHLLGHEERRKGVRANVPQVTDRGFTVYLVDDDASVVRALSRLLLAKGMNARAFTSAEDFLHNHDPDIPGCAVFDVSMPGLDGLSLHRALAAGGAERPVIFLTGRGDIPTTVRALKAGAVDFLTKPVGEMELLDAIARAKIEDAKARQLRADLAAVRKKISTLSPRELEVLARVVAGRLNKQIADELGTAEKTIKVHRGRVMAKLGVRTVPDLVRLAEKAGIPALPKP